MPIDEFLLNPMLDPFRKMVKEIEDKGVTGEDYDAMKAAMDRLEELGREKDDLNDFNGAMMQENLFGILSDRYGKCLAAEAGGGEATDPDNFDDGALLKQMVDALKGAVQRIKDGKQEAKDRAENYDAGATAQAGMEFAMRNKEQFGLEGVDDSQFTNNMDEIVDDANKEYNEKKALIADEIDALFNDKMLIEPIEKLIALAEEPGMNSAKFLRIQIEKGMDKAMEGSVVLRDGLVYSKKMTDANPPSPYHLTKVDRYIQVFDEMAAVAPFEVPDSLQLQFAHNRIDHELEPDIIRFDKIKDHWEWIIGHLDQWMKAHSKHAMGLDYYVMIPGLEPKKRAIESDKDCLPGEVKVLVKIMDDYWGYSFHDIFTHETFIHEVKWDYLPYSQEYMTFLRDKVFPACVPMQHCPQELVDEWDRMYEAKKLSNPHWHHIHERNQKVMDEVFGEGYYLKKFGAITPNGSMAEPWNVEAFNQAATV